MSDLNMPAICTVHEVMKSTLLCFFSVLVAMFCVAAPLGSQAAVAALHLSDYDAELRRPDGRVDTPLMIQRLKELDVTTYYWLIAHAATDWDDLKLFLPEAAQARRS